MVCCSYEWNVQTMRLPDRLPISPVRQGKVFRMSEHHATNGNGHSKNGMHGILA